MKKRRYALIIISFIIMLPFIMFGIDYSLTSMQKRPIFAVKTGILKDGGTTFYNGLGYKVIKYNELEGRKDVVFFPFYKKDNE